VIPPFDLGAELVSIERQEPGSIAGWFIPGRSLEAGVLLLHGVRSNRREMIGRARFLRNAGYSVLMIDMQAHGETPGSHITFGYRESGDVRRALEYLRARVSGRPVGVIGVSLGGAAILLGDAPVSADAVVLEAVYSTIQRAIENRLAIRLGPLGGPLTPLLLWQLELRFDFSRNDLSPLLAITKLKSPVMIIAGSNDRHTQISESKDLFLHAPEPKSLWAVDGAEHQNFHRYAPQVYERRVLKFFCKYLRNGVWHAGNAVRSTRCARRNVTN